MIKKIALLGSIVLITILFIYCTTDESTIIGPFGNADKYLSVASLTVDKPKLYSNGDTTIVRIKVLDVGNSPAIGLRVGFTAQFGRITESDITDSSGIALAIFISDENVGESIITVDTGVKKYTITINVIYKLKHIEIYSEFPRLIEDGNFSTNITAVLKDSVGNPMPGETVTFMTTLGELHPEVVLTDSLGMATTVLISPTVEGVATITVISSITKSIDIQFHKYLPFYIELSSVSYRLWADGESSTNITAVLKDSVGNPMPGMTVTFTTTLGTLSPAIVVTDSLGMATTVLISPTVEGVAIVIATSYISNSVEVEFNNYAPSLVEMSTSETTILADGLSGATITAIAKDSDNIPMPGINILFSTTQGVLSDSTKRTNQDGSTEINFTSTGSIINLVATIKAVVENDTSIAEDINIQLRGITSITNIDSFKMSDEGIYNAYIRTNLFETLTGDHINNGTVAFSSTIGTMNDALVAIDEQGMARSVFSAEVLPINQYSIGIESKLSSAVEVFSSSEGFEIPGAEMLVSTIDDEIMGDGVGYALVKATLREITGKAIPGTRVNWETTLGTIKRHSQTNTTGHAIDTLTIEAGVGQVTTVTIRANYGEYISANDILTIIPPATSNRIIIGAEPDITEGPCITFDSLYTCVYGIDDAGRIVYGTGSYSPTFGWPIYCGIDGDTWCYRICGQDVVQAGAYGTRDIAVTAIFKDEYNNPIYNQTLRFWLTPADALATICEQDIVPNSLGYARVTLTYPIQNGGQIVRIWAEAPDGTKGSIDVVLPAVIGE